MMEEFLKGTKVTLVRECRLASALDNLSSSTFDLVLLDATLPDAMGLEALQTLREAAPYTPVLLTGSVADDGLAQSSLRAGAQDYLLKPQLTQNGLLRALTNAVDRQALQSEAADQRARAEALARRKEQFVAMVSHEILNPMSGLLGLANLLQDTDLDGKQREYVGLITECTSSLSALVTDLLELSRLEDGRESVRQEAFSLFELADELAGFLGQNQASTDARLLLVSDPALPAQVKGDRVKIRQILYNLLQNATKFTSVGHVALRMKLLSTEEGSVIVRLMVEDTGRGIPVDKCNQIFEPFAQVQCKDRKRGHGLGLAICAQLARVMGSELKVLSEQGQGTIFWMDLRLGRCPQARPMGRPMEGQRALVLSDYEPERLAFQELLSSLGAEVRDSVPSFVSTGAFDLVVVGGEDPRHERIVASCAGKVGRVLWVSRAAGVSRGDCEVISAPLRLSHLLEAPARAGLVEAPGASVGRALVVEDDPLCQLYLERVLSLYGYQVDVAGDGAEALELCRCGTYQVVSLDGHLGDMDGPDLLRDLRNSGALDHEPTVLLVSANKTIWNTSLRGTETNVRLLGKPLLPDQLKEALQAPVETVVAWDEERITSLEALGPEAVRQLFEIFDKSVPMVLQDLDRAVISGCAASVRKLSHQVKGAAASVGASGLALCAGALEGAEQQPEQWQNLLAAIRKEFRRSTDTMKARQNERGAYAQVAFE